MTAEPASRPGESPAPLTLGDILARISLELAQSARDCTQVQWAISALLDKAHHPDLAAEMHMLQDVDRLQQTLADLACLLEATATISPDLDPGVPDLSAGLRLHSLRARLFGNDRAGSANPSATPSDGPTDDDITWL